MITADHGRNRRHRAGTLLAVSLIVAACGAGDGSESVGATTAPTTAMTAPSTATVPPTTTAAPTTAPATAPTTIDPANIDCASVPAGSTEFVLDAGGAEHDVRVHVPTTWDGSSELPLVMN